MSLSLDIWTFYDENTGSYKEPKIDFGWNVENSGGQMRLYTVGEDELSSAAYLWYPDPNACRDDFVDSKLFVVQRANSDTRDGYLLKGEKLFSGEIYHEGGSLREWCEGNRTGGSYSVRITEEKVTITFPDYSDTIEFHKAK